MRVQVDVTQHGARERKVLPQEFYSQTPHFPKILLRPLCVAVVTKHSTSKYCVWCVRCVTNHPTQNKCALGVCLLCDQPITLDCFMRAVFFLLCDETRNTPLKVLRARYVCREPIWGRAGCNGLVLGVRCWDVLGVLGAFGYVGLRFRLGLVAFGLDRVGQECWTAVFPCAFIPRRNAACAVYCCDQTLHFKVLHARCVAVTKRVGLARP